MGMVRKEKSGINKNRWKSASQVVKIILLIPVVIVFLTVIIVIAGRIINRFSHYIDASKGIDETTYVDIGGQEQYLVIRGKDINNPVILYIHGGPGGPDSAICNVFTDPLIDDYTVVCWDQRGCGRTYFRNADKDSDNMTVNFETALSDTDELVDYLLERFDEDRVIFMCHSYGTVVGTRYIQEHSDKVTAYVGIGQFVNCRESDTIAYEDALEQANAAGDDTTALVTAREDYLIGDSLIEYLKLRHETEKYHPVKISAKPFMLAVFSPYSGIDDIRWVMKQKDTGKYYELEKSLMDTVFNCNMYDYDLTYDVPMLFISGGCDYVCNYSLVERYSGDISAPYIRFELLEGLGHAPQYAAPDEVAEIIKSYICSIDN